MRHTLLISFLILEIGVHDVTLPPNGSYVDRIWALREAGGFVVGCHPQEYEHGAANIHAGAEALHAFEIFNGLREARGCNEAINIRLWDDVLTAGKRIWGIASDDLVTLV